MINCKTGRVKLLTHILSLFISTVFVLNAGTVKAYAYTDNDLMLLARVINAEAGYGCTIEHNQLVGCVVMNRVKDPRFPNTVSDVIYQKGQYPSVSSARFKEQPSQIALDAAKYVLDGKAYCPPDVIFQANFKQGKGVYKQFNVNTGYYSSTTYFCRG